MMTGQTPFKGRRHADILAEILTKPVRFPKSVKLSRNYMDFVRAVLKKPPARRVTVEEALQFPWIKGEETSDETIHEEVLKCLKQFNYQTLLKKKVTEKHTPINQYFRDSFLKKFNSSQYQSIESRLKFASRTGG